MSGLEELGIPGPASVREALSSDETFAAIEQFQVNNIPRSLYFIKAPTALLK